MCAEGRNFNGERRNDDYTDDINSNDRINAMREKEKCAR